MAINSNYTTLKDWKPRFEKGVPILMYHKIQHHPWGTQKFRFLYVSPCLFELQMNELKQSGFAVISLNEFQRNPDQRKCAILTFDDAFQSVAENALPVLSQHHFSAITYVVADKIGLTNDWDARLKQKLQPLMDRSTIAEWLAAGQEIGSHTLTHPRLSRIPISQMREEIISSKKKLEDIFGVPIRHFCYPYGDYNQQVRSIVEEAGYETATTTRPGLNTSATPRLELQRLTARFRSRSLKSILQFFKGRVAA